MADPDFPVMSLQPLSVEVTFTDVDPGVFALLTGQGEPTSEPEFAVEVWTPIRRRWWQWLLRRRKRYTHFLIPHARVTVSPPE